MIITVMTKNECKTFWLDNKYKNNELQLCELIKDFSQAVYSINWNDILLIKFNETTLYKKYII